jgi:hypothetical protein
MERLGGVQHEIRVHSKRRRNRGRGQNTHPHTHTKTTKKDAVPKEARPDLVAKETRQIERVYRQYVFDKLWKEWRGFGHFELMGLYFRL